MIITFRTRAKILGYKLEDYNLDNLNEGRVLFDLYRETCKSKYLKAIGLLHRQLEEQPRTAAGNFWHKKIYPNQVWLDGLYMAQVFYTRYETELNRGKGYADIVKQFKTVYENMYDRDKKLYYHAGTIPPRRFGLTRRRDCPKAFGCAQSVGIPSGLSIQSVTWTEAAPI